MRQLVRAVLPMNTGIILDPFMGSGATIAAASACRLQSVGLEINPEYFKLAVIAIPRLAEFTPNGAEANGEGGGGRTHTFGVKNAAKMLRGNAVYQRKDVIIRDGKPVPRNGDDEE